MVRTRTLVFCCAAAVLMLVAAGCGSAGGNVGGKPGVVATTVQVGALAKAVAGGAVSIKTLVGTGVDPHDYEASADDIRTIGDSKLVLRNGIGLDAFLDKAVAGSGQKNVVTVTGGVKIRKGEQAGSKEDDPHVWHNPENDKIMVDNIARALSAAFPANAPTFQRNADAYKKRLDDVDAEIRKLIDTLPAGNRTMVTNHDAFGYFIERYGLEFVGAVIPNVSTAAEASARQIADLEDTIRRKKVRAVFAESSLDPKVAKQIARDTGVKIVDDLYGDSLGPPGSGADTVDGMLLANAKTIVDALR